jgi:hypothetical protein
MRRPARTVPLHVTVETAAAGQATVRRRRECAVARRSFGAGFLRDPLVGISNLGGPEGSGQRLRDSLSH